MIVYLEGPDGAGKTTTIDKIKVLCDYKDIECISDGESLISTNPKKPNRATSLQIRQSFKKMAKSKKLYILDRGPISDVVYRTFDNYDIIMPLNEIVRMLKKNKKKLLLVYCDNENAEQNMLIRGDANKIAIKKHKEISKIYEMIMSTMEDFNVTNFIKYDYSKDKADGNLLRAIDKIL